MKNKILKMITILLVVSTLMINCKKNDTNNDNNKITSIITSFYPMYIMTLNVTKDINDVKVSNMTKPQIGCLHDYQLTPEDVVCLEKAQYFVINGGGMETFVNKIVKQMPNIKIIEASKGIELIKGYGDEGDNPHLWVSVSTAIKQVRNIEEQLSSLDIKNRVAYKKNADEYINKLEKLKTKMHQVLDPVKNKNIVTFHEAFPYFAKEFDLNIVDVIEREPGSEPSAKEISDIIASVKKLNVKALFAEPQYPAKAAEIIAKETGIKVYILDPGVSGDMELDSYINTMENNLITLQEALK
ncbi:MAG: metal ABC transporter substrate-binding protein [Spirochaetes bacterium GWD1_27_9]|nr:MAG: metal ABC transporter substrate-binding protein [Spirochaetes bacterium GWB1_27_13]OHD27032.1 MAG: metal ABC transporter substrate-binding protein [Spirochaetes bacterium GWC1_27_15]OHD29443.1 MAG: metal ABC transporter substrate-binding protein [Spirochaetes bacterium GWD1_27_9]